MDHIRPGAYGKHGRLRLLTKTVFTARGPLTAYVLIFIHLGSRRVFCSAPTYAPDSAWVAPRFLALDQWVVILLANRGRANRSYSERRRRDGAVNAARQPTATFGSGLNKKVNGL